MKIDKKLPRSETLSACIQVLLLCFRVRSPVRERWGDTDYVKKSKPNANLGIHAISMCYNCTEFPKSSIFKSASMFNRADMLGDIAALPYLYHVVKFKIDHYTIQAGPNIYWSKVKLLTSMFYTTKVTHQTSMYCKSSAEQHCGNTAWRYRIHGMLMPAEVDEWDHPQGVGDMVECG